MKERNRKFGLHTGLIVCIAAVEGLKRAHAAMPPLLQPYAPGLSASEAAIPGEASALLWGGILVLTLGCLGVLAILIWRQPRAPVPTAAVDATPRSIDAHGLRRRTAPLKIGNKPVSIPVHGLDDALIVVAQHLTQAADTLRDDRFAGDAPRPDRSKELVLGYDFARMAQQVAQHLQRLALQFHWLPRMGQHQAALVKADLPKTPDLGIAAASPRRQRRRTRPPDGAGAANGSTWAGPLRV